MKCRIRKDWGVAGTRILIAFMLSAILAPMMCTGAGLRPFSVGIMTQGRQVGTADFGPRGRYLLVQREGSDADSANFGRVGKILLHRYGSTLLEIRLPGTAGGRISEHAIAAPVGGGVWFRSFSPSGAEAAVAVFDGKSVEAGVYDLNTGVLRALHYEIAGDDVYVSGCPCWISDDRYIDYSPLTTASARRFGISVRNPHDHEYDHWLIDRGDRTTWAGRKAAAKVYRSGRAMKRRRAARPRGQLLWVNVRAGRDRVLSKGTFRQLSLSPGRRYLAAVAVAKTVTALDAVRQGGLSGMNVNAYQLEVYELTHEGVRVLPCPSCDVTPGSLRWSPGGEELFFDTLAIRRGHTYHRQYIFNFREHRLKRFAPTALRMQVTVGAYGFYTAPFVWLSGDEAAVRMNRNDHADSLRFAGSRAAGGRMGAEWYVVSPGRAPANLTESLKRFTHGRGGARFVAAHRGSLLMMFRGDLLQVAGDGRVGNLTRWIHERLSPWCAPIPFARNGSNAACNGIGQHVFIRPPNPTALKEGWITFRVVRRHSQPADVVFFNVDTGRVIRLAAPAPGAELIAASAPARAALYVHEGRNGDTLILARKGGSSVDLWKFNRQLKGVAVGKPVMLTHRDPGESSDRIDWLLLPPTYRKGDREPLLVYFYPLTEYSRGWNADWYLRTTSMLNMNIPAAHGFAVLLASMRMPRRPVGDPCRQMHRQLIEAAENAVEKGYADPERWALIGHSYGGYGVYCVIEHTHRFRAAIALDGFSNLTSAYGEGGFPGPGERSADLPGAMLWIGGGPDQMGAPPWVAPLRYLKNSPIFHVNRIETPVLIFNGNDDEIVDVGEAEQMFNALHLLGRTAEFVRYWGEGHVYWSPANVRDMWRRIFSWLDRYLDIARDARGHVLFRKGSVQNGASQTGPEGRSGRAPRGAGVSLVPRFETRRGRARQSSRFRGGGPMERRGPRIPRSSR